MSPAKVTLSPKERELVNNAGWILTKNTIIQKVYDLFGGLSDVYQSALKNQAFITLEDMGSRSPKISKGEQYEGLPWVMLDYPRQFTANDSFGIRSFFWWGNFCSITIQLSGRFQQKYVSSIQNYFQNKGVDSVGYKDWFIGISDDPWKHHFEKDNYEPITESTVNALPALPFIKLAKKISLAEWDQLDNFFEENFVEILAMLGNGDGNIEY